MTEKLFLTRIKTHDYDFPSAKEQGIDSAKAIRCVMSSFNLQKHMSQYGTWQYLTVPFPCMLLARIHIDLLTASGALVCLMYKLVDLDFLDV